MAYAFQNTFYRCINLIDTNVEININGFGGNSGGAVFHSTFYGCTSIKKTPIINLPTWSLDSKYYASIFANMFYSCSSLEEFRGDIAGIENDININLPGNVFQNMFINCFKLKKAFNKLYPTGFNQNCFANTFQNCMNLEETPEIEIKNLPSTNTFAMTFNGCVNLKKVNIKFNINSSILATVFNNTFSGCENIEEVSELKLNTTTFGSNALQYLFQNCYKLKNVKISGHETANATGLFTGLF